MTLAYVDIKLASTARKCGLSVVASWDILMGMTRMQGNLWLYLARSFLSDSQLTDWRPGTFGSSTFQETTSSWESCVQLFSWSFSNFCLLASEAQYFSVKLYLFILYFSFIYLFLLCICVVCLYMFMYTYMQIHRGPSCPIVSRDVFSCSRSWGLVSYSIVCQRKYWSSVEKGDFQFGMSNCQIPSENPLSSSQIWIISRLLLLCIISS